MLLTVKSMGCAAELRLNITWALGYYSLLYCLYFTFYKQTLLQNCWNPKAYRMKIHFKLLKKLALFSPPKLSWMYLLTCDAIFIQEHDEQT